LYDAARVILRGFKYKIISGGGRCTFKESNTFFFLSEEMELILEGWRTLFG
jgi:hypothetical protein